MPTAHVVEIEIDQDLDDEILNDHVMDTLAPHHVALAATTNPEHMLIVITLDEPDLITAIKQGAALAGQFGAPVSVSATPEDLRDQREALLDLGVDLDGVISPPVAAEMLGVNQQAVLKLVKKHRIRGIQLTDKSWMLDRSSVESYVSTRK